MPFLVPPKWLKRGYCQSQYLCALKQIFNDWQGAKLARGRREWTKLEERRAREDRQAAFRADTTGRAVIRRGHFWLG